MAEFNPQHPAHAVMQIEDREAGRIVAVPPRKKVALVGFATSSRDYAPYDDAEFEIWGLNQLYRHEPRFDRWFEMHTRTDFLADTVRDTNYLAWLQRCPIPILMEETHADIPNSVRYPLDRMIARFGRDYFTSTIAYQLALAIAEGFEEIRVYGVDLVVGDEYFYQKACAEYWLGVAAGLGVRVVLPEQTALLKQRFRYGYQKPVPAGPFSLPTFDTRESQLMTRRNELLTQINALEGAISEIRYHRQLLELHEKGVTYSNVSTSTK